MIRVNLKEELNYRGRCGGCLAIKTTERRETKEGKILNIFVLVLKGCGRIRESKALTCSVDERACGCWKHRCGVALLGNVKIVIDSTKAQVSLTFFFSSTRTRGMMNQFQAV